MGHNVPQININEYYHHRFEYIYSHKKAKLDISSVELKYVA